jgi:hypothetical protein
MKNTIQHIVNAIAKINHDIYSKEEVLFILRQIHAEADKEYQLAQEAGQISEQRLEEVAKSICNHAAQVHKELVKQISSEVEDHIESFDFADYAEVDVNPVKGGKLELNVTVTDELTDTLQTELTDLMFNPQTVTTFRRKLESLVFPAK